ncbi:diacylglycerol kinase family protein [Lagierella sp.]|uniref:diacylglycerol/lipid kinase family protein n=1 Tax=Lagierella sp. TaxID=2849657 RepID=UPI0026080681|nr:diacylglycerol kinase family protein [Lagierella sp.]
MNKRRLILIINPNSGLGDGQRLGRELIEYLDGNGIAYEVYFTTKHRNAKAIATDLTKTLKEDISLISLGGDGTLNEVINGLYNHAKINLTVIPVGSGNDFVRSFKHPKTPIEMLKCSLNPRKFVDYNIGEIHSKGKKRKFIVTAGSGYDGSLALNVNNPSLRRRFKGSSLKGFMYIYSGVKALVDYRPVKGKITVDGVDRSFENIYFATVMNTPYAGKGFNIAPMAKGDDGVMEFCLVHSKSKGQMLPILLKGLAFGLKKGRNISYYRGRNFSFSLSAPVICHTDGEYFGEISNADIRVLEERVRVVVE